MALTFFTDHCVPRQVGAVLQQAGHTVLQLRDVMQTDAPDEEVLARAQDLDAILVSLNGDFSDIVRYRPADYGGIIALQAKGRPHTLAAMLARLSAYVDLHPERDHYKGRLLLVETHRIRMRQ